MCTVAAASGAASVRVWHITSRGWDPWTERPLPEVVRVAYPPAIVDVYKIETDDSVSHQNLVTDGIRNIHSLETKDIGLSILVDTCSCRVGRAKSQVDAFTCFGRILNLLEELLLPDRIVECRNCLCSTGQISAQRHIQVAEFRYACL